VDTIKQNKKEQFFDLLNQNQSLETSDRYKLINTGQVLGQLQKQGFEVKNFNASNVRKKTKEGFQAHMVELYHPKMQLTNHTDLEPRLLLWNSYDKSCSLQISLGLYRFVCSNGLVIGDDYAKFNMKHLGDIETQLNNFLPQLNTSLKKANNRIELFKSTHLTVSQSLQLTHNIVENTVFKNRYNVVKDNLIQYRFNASRRIEDDKTDLFTTLNRIQENIIQGGITYKTISDKGIKRQSTKKVTSIFTSKKFNNEVWLQSGLLLDKILKEAV